MTENIQNKQDIVDLSEKGRAKDGTDITLDRRLFIQFLAFGNVNSSESIINLLVKNKVDGALYLDINDSRGLGLLTFSEDPNFFVMDLRDLLNQKPFVNLIPKQEFTMLGRTYTFGYENDLERTLISGPKFKILDKQLPWAIWYPLRRAKSFETLSEKDQKEIIGEHGKIGFKFGRAGYAKDIRLACHGLDKDDNDFVIGVLGKELFPLSAIIQAMRKTKQTSTYLESLGPFFIGKAVWQSEIND